MPNDAAHWQDVYSCREPEELSWYQPNPERSLALIESAEIDRGAAILDLGGGASRLAAALLEAGYRDLTVADISAEALDRARADLGADAGRVRWLELDVRSGSLERRYDLWHDRAVLHFMVAASDRDGYLQNLRAALRPGGHLILAAFGPNGPTSCSGLSVHPYGVEELVTLLGAEFELLSSELEDHRTPSGARQQFLYVHLRRRGPRARSPIGRDGSAARS